MHIFTLIFRHRLFYCIALYFFSIAAFSATGHFYLSTSLGNSFATLGSQNPQISYEDNLITDTYPLNNTHASTSVVSVNSGYEFIGNNWLPAIGVGGGIYTTPVGYNYRGQLVETAAGDPSSALYDYSYNIANTRAMAEIQFTWLLKTLSPFIDVGLGIAWNKMNGYTEMPTTSNGYVPLLPFQGHTNVNFAYQVGLGVSTAFNFSGNTANFLQERISLGYRYANSGTTTSGTRGSAYPYSLNAGLLRTNDLYLSYTHLF